MPRAILDTNVLVAALRSSRGASFRLLSLIGKERFEIAVSVALVLEYEDALSRHLPQSPLDGEDLRDLLDFLCAVAHQQEIFYLWRPFLRDPADDMVLELAVASRAQYIVTFNHRHFRQCDRFGVAVVSPREFLREIGEIP